MVAYLREHPAITPGLTRIEFHCPHGKSPMKPRLILIALALTAALTGSLAYAQAQGSVTNSTLTSNIVDGAPVDFRQQFSNTAPSVYFYAELLGLSGQTVKIRWSLEGKPMQETSIEVKSARQTSWSMMKMQPQWTGNWLVEVVNGKGHVIEQQNFAFNPSL
jgi:hypothetical protein